MEDEDYALLVPSLTALPWPICGTSLPVRAHDRERILAALDHLFIGF